MSWPPASDYQDAIQNPAFCFLDTDLKGGEPAVNRLGLPFVASGNFASVYQIRRPPERWAVRCFLRQGADQQRRYSLLSGYLTGHSLPGLVGFSYLAQGIRVRAQWRPIVKMEWVEGVTLQTYVARHARDAAKLKSLADQWCNLLEGLRRAGIAHGDLQHGNVLVTPQEELRLVDYDGMYVPPLKGLPGCELGHANYQHPARSAADYDVTLDNFAGLVIYTALRALVAEPGLWDKFDTGENLLFSATDYRAPDKSALFERLRTSQDQAVQTLAARIVEACAGPMARTPDFCWLVGGLPPIEAPRPWWLSDGPSSDAAEPPMARRAPRKAARQPKPILEDPNLPVPDPRPPWWKRPPKSHFYGLALRDLFAPAKLAEIVRNKAFARPKAVRVRPAPARKARRKAAGRSRGCQTALALGCLSVTTVGVGLALAVQFAVQRIRAWVAPPPAPPAARVRGPVTPAGPRR